jgi:hypothetical protein
VWRVGHEDCWQKLEVERVEIDQGSTRPKRADMYPDRLTGPLSVHLSVGQSRAAAPPVVRSLAADIVGLRASCVMGAAASQRLPLQKQTPALTSPFPPRQPPSNHYPPAHARLPARHDKHPPSVGSPAFCLPASACSYSMMTHVSDVSRRLRQS